MTVVSSAPTDDDADLSLLHGFEDLPPVGVAREAAAEPADLPLHLGGLDRLIQPTGRAEAVHGALEGVWHQDSGHQQAPVHVM